MSEFEPKEIPVEILPHQLSESALKGIIENFILREGTDYGLAEVSYESKEKQILKQIDKGEIKIIFDQSSETVSLLTASDFKKLMQNLR